MTLTFCFLAAAVVAADASTRRLASTVARAMQRAGLTQDYVARCTGIPPNKLSLQLSGQAPFTGLCRILISEELRRETDFFQELVALLAEQVDRALVPRDLGRLVAKVERLTERKTMARMESPFAPRPVVVRLPLNQERA